MNDQKKPVSMQEKRAGIEARLAQLRSQKVALIAAMRKREVRDEATFTRLAGVGVLKLLADAPTSVNAETVRAAIRAAALKGHEKRALESFGAHYGFGDNEPSLSRQELPFPPKDIIFRDSGNEV